MFDWDSMKNKIILADNKDIMKDIPDKFFELAIVDPPYKDDLSGLNVGINRNFKYSEFKSPNKNYFKELFRISKNQIIWGGNYFIEHLKNTDGFICWYKHQNGHFSECELAWTNIGKGKFFDRAYQRDIGNKIHPTQKPIALYRWLLQNYAKPGDKIIDTHSGSGSLACACHLEKFEFLAIEKDEDYYKASVKRLEEIRSQGVLF